MRLIPYLGAQPVDDFGHQISGEMYSAALAASTDTTLTVPSTASNYKAVFDFGKAGDVWVAVNQTATLPAGAAFASTNSRLNPRCLEVKAGDELHFITSTASNPVSVSFYTLKHNN